MVSTSIMVTVLTVTRSFTLYILGLRLLLALGLRVELLLLFLQCTYDVLFTCRWGCLPAMYGLLFQHLAYSLLREFFFFRPFFQ